MATTNSRNGDARHRLDEPAFVRRLERLGVDSDAARRIAASEYRGEHLHAFRNGLRNDHRVIPHPAGWVVTRRVDTSDARYFAEIGDAEHHAIQLAATRRDSGIVFYCRDGRVQRRVFFPRWR